jgi:hypothetical protein
MKKTLLTIGIFAVIGMASTGVAVVWFGETQLPQRECSAAEAVQNKVLMDRFDQDFKTNTFRSHEPLAFCYEEGKRITTAEWYAELGKEIEQTPSLLLGYLLMFSFAFGAFGYFLWGIFKGLIWVFNRIGTRLVAANVEAKA